MPEILGFSPYFLLYLISHRPIKPLNYIQTLTPVFVIMQKERFLQYDASSQKAFLTRSVEYVYCPAITVCGMSTSNSAVKIKTLAIFL